PERLATPQAFARDPRLVWEWYDWRRGVIRKAEPNPGHLALAEFERRKLAGNTAQHPYAMGRSPGANNSAGNFTLVTQNVDGLHGRAGSRNVVPLHGDIWQVRCIGCGIRTRNEEAPLSQ